MNTSVVMTVIAISLFFVSWPMGAKLLGIPGQWVAPLMLANTMITVLAISARSIALSTLPVWPIMLAYFIVCIGNGWASVAYGRLTGNSSVPLGDVIVLQSVMSITFAVLAHSLLIARTLPSLPKIGAYVLCIVAVYAVVKTQ